MKTFMEWCREKGFSLVEKKLTTAERHALPKKDFALPGERYPIEDENHARNALARVSQHGSPSEKKTVRKKVHEKFPEIGKDKEEKKKD